MHCGTLDSSDNFVDTDISGEPTEVSAVCTAVWTDSVKDAWKAKLIADKSVQVCKCPNHTYILNLFCGFGLEAFAFMWRSMDLVLEKLINLVVGFIQN